MANPAADIRAAAQSRWPGATVQGRGRTWLLHRHPTDPRRFMLDAEIGPIHTAALAEIDTAWQPDTGAWQWKMEQADYQAHARSVLNAGDAIEVRLGADWVIFQPLSLNWVNQDNSRQQIATPAAVTAQVVDGDTLRWAAAYGAGRHFTYQAQTGRLAKLTTIDSMLNLPPATVLGTVWLEQEFIIKNSTGVELYLDGVRWTRANNVRVRTSNAIEFRDAATGTQTLWTLDGPRCYDSAGRETFGQYEVRRQGGASYFITVRIPKSFVDAATFPLFMDPTVDVQVGANNDDGYEISSGAISRTSFSLILDVDTNWGLVRFSSVTGPASGDTIDAAWLEFKPESTTYDDPSVDIYGVDVDNPVEIAAVNFNITSRARTSAVTTWTATGIGAAFVQTPSIVAQVQEIVDRAGWASGNAMAFVLDVLTGSVFRPKTRDSGAGEGAKLHFEYTAGAAPAAAEPPRTRMLLGVGV